MVEISINDPTPDQVTECDEDISEEKQLVEKAEPIYEMKINYLYIFLLIFACLLSVS